MVRLSLGTLHLTGAFDGDISILLFFVLMIPYYILGFEINHSYYEKLSVTGTLMLLTALLNLTYIIAQTVIGNYLVSDIVCLVCALIYIIFLRRILVGSEHVEDISKLTNRQDADNDEYRHGIVHPCPSDAATLCTSHFRIGGNTQGNVYLHLTCAQGDLRGIPDLLPHEGNGFLDVSFQECFHCHYSGGIAIQLHRSSLRILGIFRHSRAKRRYHASTHHSHDTVFYVRIPTLSSVLRIDFTPWHRDDDIPLWQHSYRGIPAIGYHDYLRLDIVCHFRSVYPFLTHGNDWKRYLSSSETLSIKSFEIIRKICFRVKT